MERPRSIKESFVPPTRRRILRKFLRVCKRLTDFPPDDIQKRAGWIYATYPLNNDGEVYVERRLRDDKYLPIARVIISDSPFNLPHVETEYYWNKRWWKKRSEITKSVGMVKGKDVDLPVLSENTDFRELDPEELAKRVIEETDRQLHELKPSVTREEASGIARVSDGELRELIDLLKSIKY